MAGQTTVSLSNMQELERGDSAKISVKEDVEDSVETASSSMRRLAGTSLWIVTVFIFILGLGASSAFAALGISGAKSTEEEDFTRDASDLVRLLTCVYMLCRPLRCNLSTNNLST
jgi:hypothetical protein